MTENAKNKKGLLAYFESIGILENGTQEQFNKARKEYEKIYIREYKRKERSSKSEFIVLLSKQKGELKTVSEAAKEHKVSISNFIKASALAYLQKTYLVPDTDKVAELELTLSACRNEIQKISKNPYFPIADKIQAIERRIEKMETAINDLFRHPPEAT